MPHVSENQHRLQRGQNHPAQVEPTAFPGAKHIQALALGQRGKTSEASATRRRPDQGGVLKQHEESTEKIALPNRQDNEVAIRIARQIRFGTREGKPFARRKQDLGGGFQEDSLSARQHRVPRPGPGIARPSATQGHTE
jgi:hypothetical protein